MAGTVALLLAVVAGCTGDDEPGPVVLNWYVFPEPGGAFDTAAERCTEQANGRYRVNIELLPTEADDQREQLVRRLAAEDTGPDILGMDVIWTGEFANAGWVREWTGERRERVSEGVFESVLESASFEDRLWAAPFTTNTQLLWYRSDRVDEPPDTWDEMIEQAERLPSGQNRIQVQADRYEGLTVWALAMIASAGGEILADDQEDVALQQGPTERALATMGRLARSDAADPGIATSDEDSARLAFEGGSSAFMVNYPFVFPSAEENAPEVFRHMEAAKFPSVDEDTESAPPLGGLHLGVSAFSEHPELAFDAVECLRQPENQITAAEEGGLPPTQEGLYDTERIREAYPGFADLMRESIEAAEPRPSAVAYQDLSLAIQRSVHPVGGINPDNPTPTYRGLLDRVRQAVEVEGLL